MTRQRGVSLDAAALAAALLVAAPVLVGIGYAAAASVGVAGPGAAGAGVERLTRVLSDRATWMGFGFTLWIAALSTTLATAGAVGVAALFRSGGRMDALARGLAALPLAVPHLVAGALGVWILGQSGLLARLGVAVGLVHTPAELPALVYDRLGLGIALTMAWKECAFLTVVATTLLASRTRAVEEAARTLGAGSWTTFRRVTWPILWRGLLPSIVAVFVFVAGSYEGAALLAPSNPLVLPLLVADRAADPDLSRRGDAYVVSLLLLGLAAVAVVAHEWSRARLAPIDE